MAWLAIDKDGTEFIYDFKPVRPFNGNKWDIATDSSWYINLPKGTIEKIIGKNLTWEDEPVKI